MKDYPQEKDLDKEKSIDEQVMINITRDKMLGVISFEPPENGGKTLTKEAIYKKLKDKGIVSGIDQTLLNELVEDKRYDYKYIIARGRPAKNGEDGTIEFLFETEPSVCNSLKPKENEDGSVDFKTLDIVQTVEKDQPLVRITLPTPGEAGENILGKTIRPKPGKKVRLPTGKNIYTSSDGLTLLSSMEGQIVYEFGKINITETYIVEGNAGVATGDINFRGNVLVKGNVESDFTIKAGGNVEVLGFVEGATIIAEGDILLRHGIQGMEKGRLVAGGDIVTKFIQNSVVETKGCLYTEAIIHSQVAAENSVIVEVNKGLIVGGTIQATKLISAKVIGSPMSTVTDIQINMELSLYREYKAIEATLAKNKQQLAQVEKNIKYVHDRLAKGQQISNDLLTKTKQMIAVQKQLREEIPILEKEYKVLNIRRQNFKQGTIKVSNIIYPGVKITMGTIVKYVRSDIKYANLYIKDKEIKIDTFS